MKYFNELLTNLLSQLGELINTNITMYDSDYSYVTGYASPLTDSRWDLDEYVKVYSKQKTLPICNCIKIHNCIDKCVKDDYICLNKLTEMDENSFIHTCWFGLSEIVIKLKTKDICHSNLLIGPFRMPKNDKIVLENIQKFSKEKNIDEQILIDSYYNIPLLDQSKYDAICSLCSIIFDYFIYNHIINLDNNNIFNNEIKPYINDNLHTPLTIDQLSSKFYLSRKQINSIFIKNVKTSPKKYINSLKINKAKNLIISTDLSLSTIAKNVGFDNYNYFIKAFKLYDGNMPSFYRKKS